MTSWPFLLCHPQDKLYMFSFTPCKTLTQTCCSNVVHSIQRLVGVAISVAGSGFSFPQIQIKCEQEAKFIGIHSPVVSRDIAKMHSDAICWLQCVGSEHIKYMWIQDTQGRINTLGVFNPPIPPNLCVLCMCPVSLECIMYSVQSTQHMGTEILSCPRVSNLLPLICTR